MKTTIRTLSILLLLGAFCVGLSACNTMHGVGKDTEKAGQKIEKEADEHKHKDKDDR